MTEKIRGVRTAKPATWYRQIKTLTGRVKSQQLNFDEYDTRQALAEAVNRHFATISSQLPALNLEEFPAYLPANAPPPVIRRAEVQRELSSIPPTSLPHRTSYRLGWSGSLLSSYHTHSPTFSTPRWPRGNFRLPGSWPLSLLFQKLILQHPSTTSDLSH